ncbi:hypothetical protein L210DRAFT_878220 [Boletus edulis BED1]|uniref:Uncharacterized protein n=1 Tax=Boletus edulis BED1 TaxID=1328754 RepID=A0AAD4BBZ9_BOLED|nr:hypothetical protein L210DRAFT_878220 [Boletus edulis BED1]
MLSVDASGKMIRFAKAIFAERVCNIYKGYYYAKLIFRAQDKPAVHSPGICYYDVVVNPTDSNEEDVESTVDEETNNWPVEKKYKEALNEIKHTHHILPLHIYKNDEYVEPSNVNGVLQNAMVEVLFTVHHTYLGTQVPPHDTFRANIEQIIVLKQESSLDETSYSKTNVRSGPIAAGSFSMKRQIGDDDECNPRRQKIRSTKGKGNLAVLLSYPIN